MNTQLPESMSPRRWQWILLSTIHRTVRFVYWPPQQPLDHRDLRGYDRNGLDIARLVWRVCDTCRVGSINKVSIDPDHQRQGLGRRMILRALDDGPDYAWQTTHQSPTAKLFFPALAAQTGIPLTQYAGICNHLRAPDGYRPSPTSRRPSPVLERGV